jgi:hypothetical protein
MEEETNKYRGSATVLGEDGGHPAKRDAGMNAVIVDREQGPVPNGTVVISVFSSAHKTAIDR